MANSLVTQQLGLPRGAILFLSDCERAKGPFRVESWFRPVLLGIPNVSLIPGPRCYWDPDTAAGRGRS